jgi:hypothetical protein
MTLFVIMLALVRFVPNVFLTKNSHRERLLKTDEIKLVKITVEREQNDSWEVEMALYAANCSVFIKTNTK